MEHLKENAQWVAFYILFVLFLVSVFFGDWIKSKIDPGDCDE